MKKLYNILFLLSVSVPILLAQMDIEATVKTPQVGDMIRYGNIPVSQYVGRLDLQIPLTSIEDQDFSFPLALIYNSSGFMPMKNDGLTGLNWSLSGIGSIVREVKGFPDDMPIYHSPGTAYTEYGFMYFLKHKNRYNHNAIIHNPPKYVPNEILPIHTPRFYDAGNSAVSGWNYVEASSDIYHFNFGKHSGKFMINFDGSVNVISHNGHKYDVDLSYYMYATFQGGTTASSITITTDDGYKYIFGGTYDAVEYSLQWQNHFQLEPINGWNGLKNMIEEPGFYITISSFSLSKIIAPSGRVLDIIYKKLPTDFYNRTPSKMYNALSSESAINYRQFFQSSYTHSYHKSYASNDPLYQPSEFYAVNHTLTKQPLIESIQTDDQLIRFYYIDNNRTPVSKLQEMKADRVFPLEDVAGAHLSQITHSVKYTKENSYKRHRTIDLKYQKWAGDTDRTLLSSVSSNDQGKYLLTYDTGIAAPSLLTFNIDHWNYWKPYSRLSRLHLLSGGNHLLWDDIEYNIGGERDADKHGASFGMLTQIIYPTGGKSVFEYERHDYREEIIRNKASSFFPRLTEWSNNVTAGGSRIKSITDYDNTTGNPASLKRYYYRHNIDSIKSSGILIHKPTYVRASHYINSGALGDHSYSYMTGNVYIDASNIGFSTITYEHDHLVYSTVIETQSKNEIIIRTENYSIFYNDQRKECEFNIPTRNAEIQTQTIVGTGETSSIHILDSRGETVKKIIYTPEDNLIKFYYTAQELGLSPNNKYKLVLEAGQRSRIDLNLSYEESQGNPSDKSILITKFISHKDSPDNFDHLSLYGAPSKEYHPMSAYLYIDSNDFSYTRGKVKQQSYYNGKKQLIKSISYNYMSYGEGNNAITSVYFKKTTPITTRNSQVELHPRIRIITRFGNSYAPFYHMVRFTQQVHHLQSVYTMEYIYEDDKSKTPAQVLTSHIKYTYMDAPYYYKKSETFQDSQGQTRTTNYKYAYEMESEVYRQLAQKHILSLIVEVDEKIDGETVSLLRNNYAFKNRLVIESIEEGRNRNLLRPIYMVKSFTSLGNPAHVVLNRGKELFYIWDRYYLIGKVENPDKYFSTDYSGQTLDEIRKQVPETFITTYNYQTPFELTSITDVKGIPIYYEYNTKNGSLERVYSIIGENKYPYNYYKINIIEQ